MRESFKTSAIRPTTAFLRLAGYGGRLQAASRKSGDSPRRLRRRATRPARPAAASDGIARGDDVRKGIRVSRGYGRESHGCFLVGLRARDAGRRGRLRSRAPAHPALRASCALEFFARQSHRQFGRVALQFQARRFPAAAISCSACPESWPFQPALWRWRGAAALRVPVCDSTRKRCQVRLANWPAGGPLPRSALRRPCEPARLPRYPG